MPLSRRIFLAVLLPTLAFVGFLAFSSAQTTLPILTVRSHPGGQCAFSATPQYDIQDATWWACRGTFTGNPSDWARGTWTQVTPPTTLVAGDGKGGFLTATAAQVNALATASAGVAAGSVASAGLAANTIQFVSVPLSLSALQTLNSIPVQVLPAYGSGTFTEIQSCALDLKRGSAAFTGGGTVTIGYGTTAPTVAGAATIASTVFTTFAASQLITVAGALAVNAASGVLNLPVWMQAGSADFAVGTGASGVLDCAYRVHSGFSLRDRQRPARSDYTT